MIQRILRIWDVAERTGYCRAWIYRMERAGHFPRRIRLGPNSVGWLEHEVDGWITERVQGSRGGEDLAEPRGPEA
jgi:prophage regulatory protein